MCSGMRLGRDDLVELNSCACAQCARGHVRKCKCKSIVSPLRLTHSLLHARSFAGRHVWPCAGTCARHRVVTGACRHERMRQCICENAGLVSRSPGTRIHPRRHAYRRAGAQARRLHARTHEQIHARIQPATATGLEPSDMRSAMPKEQLYSAAWHVWVCECARRTCMRAFSWTICSSTAESP